MNISTLVFIHPILATSGTHWSIFILIIGLALIATAFVLGSAFLQRWLGVKREQAFLLTVATVLSAIGYGTYRAWQADELHRRGVLHMGDMDTAILAAICSGLFIVFAAPLALKLYRAWTGAHVTEAEKLPGGAGVRAWFSATNLVFAVLISICAAFAFDCSFLTILILILLVLIGFPVINTILQMPAVPVAAQEAETLSAEREKVLSMLEAGKITAEESAELLNALAATKTPEPRRNPIEISPQRRLMLIGAALVLIGFFLPWFSINPGKEISRMTGQMQGMMNGMMMQNFNESPNSAMPSFTFNTPSVNISGGEVAHGLGWLVLVLSLGVAVMPFVAHTLDAQMQRTIAILALGAGAILLLYLLASNVRFLNAGIILASAGYVVEFASVLKGESGIAFMPAMRESARS